MTTLPGYHLREKIYHGTRTVVYRGTRLADNRSVVIKFLHNEYPTFADLLLFRNQYTVAKNLNLPGIVQPLALESYGNGYGLVMPDEGYIALGEWQQGEFAIVDVLTIAVQLADILHGLHQNRVIHKDLKPANILIHPKTKHVKLIDFSIASLLPKETQEIQNPNVLEGTLAYISPEQTGRMNRGIDYRTDFYSVGITLYELLTGELPFQSDDPMELVHCHIAKSPMRMGNGERGTGNGKWIPPVLAEVVMKLMEKNAEDRYQSALGLKYDLEKCLFQWKDTGTIEPFALGERDICDRFIIPEKLYGRENEVAQLLAAFARVASPPENRDAAGNTEMMLVAGFSGIGKTAVVNEVHKPIVEARGYFIKGKFDQFNRNIPFSAFVQALRNLMGQLLSESDAQLETWKIEILQALGENAQVIVDVIPELEQILGKQPPVPELSGSAAQNRFNLLFGKFIQVFSTPEHPLVIFLDDLQWADSASLNLLKLLADETGGGYLLVLGAYRDNEVFEAHPLMLTLDEIEKAGAILNTITLKPLSEEDLNQLVSDTMMCSSQLSVPLTTLVYQKTQGNPFFGTQFLKGLHEDGEITFNFDAGYWQCEMTQVQQLALTDDVVEFMASRLHKLPQETLEVLKLAACIGNQFELGTLAIVCEQSSVEVATALWRALQEGLVLPVSDTYKFFQETNPQENERSDEIFVGYKFLHDRVQQAAYSLMTQEQKQGTHLEIGTLLLENLSEIEREERIFEIVNHLNIGRTLITQPSQREELTQLNLQAGRKAKASTAYAAAFTYIKVGIELLPDRCWENYYQLSISLYKERADVEYLNGNFINAEGWIERTLDKARTPMEKAEVYNMSIVQHTLQAKYPEAIQAGRKALALIDIQLPEEDFDRVRDAELAIAQEILKDRSFASLSELPLMTQPDRKMAIELLISMGPPTYRSHQKLWSVICAKAVNLCLQSGNTPEIGYIYPAFGGLRGYALNNYQGTQDLLDVTIQLTQDFNNKSAQSVAYLMIGSSLRHWSHPLKFATEDYLASYRVGLESSNLQYAAYAFGHNMYCRFYQSIHLKELVDEISTSLGFSQKYKNQWAIDLLVGGRSIVAQLLGENSDSPEKFVIADESDYLKQCHERKNWQVICIYNILKTQLLFVLDRPDEALEYGKQADAEIINVAPQGLLPYARHLFIYSLVLASLYSKASESQKLDDWAKISTYQKQLEIWAQNCPENFLHLSCLVKAEVARISGNFLDAIELYDRAIAGAHINGYTQEEALANELAAKFYLHWGKEKIARVYIVEAYYGYARWGAKAKIERLAQQYPHLLASILQQHPSTPNSHTTHTLKISTHGTSTLDITSAIKASQAISGEIELDALLSKLMSVVLENAGADKGALILNHSGTWEIAAQCQKDICSISTVPLDDAETLPSSILNTVKRTQKTLLINDISQDSTVAGQPYFIEWQPKSLFCTPILKQGQLRGILYLENHHTPDAFTPDRIELLNLLISQAAISLENAHLYNTLEQKVEQRTAQLLKTLEDLKATQKKLVESEKMAALGNLVAGVAHEINTPVGTSITVASTLADETQTFINAVRGGQLKRSVLNNYLELAEESTQLMLSNLHRAGDLIQSFKQIANDQSCLERRCFHLQNYIEEIALSLDPQLKQTPHTLTVEGDETLIVESYPGALAQIATNLVTNSLTHAYSPSEAGQLRFDIRQEGDKVKIEYEDNGCGIAQENIDKIFEPFFTTARHRGGTGLGLHIVYNLVTQKLQGTIDVRSKINEGTRFIVTLPLFFNA